MVQNINNIKRRSLLGNSQLIDRKGGTDIGVLSAKIARDVISKDNSYCLSTADCTNAFNSISREKQYDFILEHIPSLSNWFYTLYGQEIIVNFNNNIIDMKNGNIQGLTSSMMAFSVGKHIIISDTLHKLQQTGRKIDVEYAWDYVDDNLILLKVKELEYFYEMLIKEYKK